MSKFSPYNIFHSIDFTKENTSKKSFYTEIPNKSIICLICNQQILEEKYLEILKIDFSKKENLLFFCLI